MFREVIGSQATRSTRWAGLLLSACIATSFIATSAAAQGFPSKAVRVIVPTTPGVVPDIFARLISQKLGEIWNVPVVVENRAGAAGSIGASFVAKSDPDGYTILFADSAVWAINPHVYPKLPYDPLKDLAPVIQTQFLPVYLTVNSSFPAKSVDELVAYAKANPGKIAYSTPGAGSSGHLAAEMFRTTTGIQLLHVPYKGAEGIQALLSGDVQLSFYGLVAIEAQAKAGKFRVLATTTPRRSSALPDVPTLAEHSVPGFDLSPTFGALVPAGTPPAIIAKINAGIAQAIADPAVAARLASFGTLPVPDATPAHFGEAIRSEYDKFGKLIKQIGIRLD